MVVLGTLPALGNWQQEQALRLTPLEVPFWQAEVLYLCTRRGLAPLTCTSREVT